MEAITDGGTRPEAVIAWVQAFIDAHHKDVPFIKRKRKPHGTGQEEFSRPPRGRVR